MLYSFVVILSIIIHTTSVFVHGTILLFIMTHIMSRIIVFYRLEENRLNKMSTTCFSISLGDSPRVGFRIFCAYPRENVSLVRFGALGQ